MSAHARGDSFDNSRGQDIELDHQLGSDNAVHAEEMVSNPVAQISDTIESVTGLTEEDGVHNATLESLVRECYSVREALNGFRDQVTAEGAGDGPVIGGDIQHIIRSSVEVGESYGEINCLAISPDKEAISVPGAEAEMACNSVERVNIRGVGVAHGLDEKTQEGTILPLVCATTDSHAVETLVKKRPGSFPLKAGQIQSLEKTKLKLPSPSEKVAASSPSTSPSKVKKQASPERPQTARHSGPVEFPLDTGVSRHRVELNRHSTDFARLFKPTTSSSAKTVPACRPKSSPGKSLGNTSSRKSTYMMEDVSANGTLGSPTATAAIGDQSGGSNLKEQFSAFSRFGDSTSDGKQITLSNCDKWMKQAHVIDGKKITTTDTSIAFKKVFKTAKKVGFEDFKKYVEDLAKSKGIEGRDILEKLSNCGAPGLSQATKAAHASVVSRLTDPSRYTGSHKERFDASGRGRGIEGRRDVQDSSGYVASFKAKQEIQTPSSK